ncbi:MAG: hypothetical protein EOM68_29885, partial [Spirochaetia bacterium]|nr:hypothetical protein [Spirochaetia bacterium]
MLANAPLKEKIGGLIHLGGFVHNLPRLLQGYGKKHDPQLTVVVVCDLDTRCLKQFRQELDRVLRQCAPRPGARFCIAVEEMEAWFLGNNEAVLKAYPKAKTAVLKTYRNDDICGTWERLADAVYPDGAKALKKKGVNAVLVVTGHGAYIRTGAWDFVKGALEK